MVASVIRVTQLVSFLRYHFIGSAPCASNQSYLCLSFLSVPLYEMVVMRLGSEAKQVAFSYIGTIIYNHSVTGLT